MIMMMSVTQLCVLAMNITMSLNWVPKKIRITLFDLLLEVILFN